MLTHITLTNFQKHRYFEASFSEGLNLVVGENWAGKSTVQRAILYALFGSTAVPTSADTLVTHGESGMQVVLGFDNYLLTRGRNKALLERDKELVASGQTSVTAAVEELLGISAKNFLAFRVARQDEAGALLSLGAAKLAKFVNEVTGIDLVDRVLDRARERLTQVKYEIGRCEGDVDKYGHCVGVCKELTAEVELLNAKLALSHASCEEARLASVDLAAASTQLIAARQAGSQALWQREEIQRRVEELKRQLTPFLGSPPACMSEELLATLQQEIFDGHAKQEHINAQRSWQLVGQQELENARQAVSHLSIELAKPVPERAPLEKRTSAAVAAHHAAIFDVRRLQGALTQEFCPTCLRPYDAHQGALREEIEQSLKAAEDAVNAAEADLAAVEELLAEADARIAAHEQARANLEQWEALHERTRVRLEEMEEKLAALGPAPDEALLAALAERYSTGRAQQQAALEFQSKKKLFQDSLAECRARLEGVVIPPMPSAEEVAAAEDASKQASSYWLATTDWHRALTAEQQGKTAALEQALREKAFVEGQLAAGAAARALKDRLDRLSKYLSGNRDRFSAEVWKQILGFAGTFIQQATGGSVRELIRTNEGEFEYLEEGRQLSVELASGMQRAILGTGLKLSLGAALGGPADFILLDEVSASASDENSLMLADLLSQTGQQVILISHRQADAAVARHVIHVG